MKLHDLCKIDAYRKSLPSRGARVEITRSAETMEMAGVAPLAGSEG